MNDGKCALFIRTSVTGGIVSMSQMSRNLSPPKAEPVKRGLPTLSSLLSTVIWVKNFRSRKGLKQCLGGLKCSQNIKKNKKTLKISFKAIFTGKNNGFPFLDILGNLKNTHKNPKFGRVRQVPTRELGWELPGWDLSHFAKFGIFMGIL